MTLNVLLVASEAMPLAKSGGLGDMVSAYAAALRDAGVDVSILLPAYPSALENALGVTPVCRIGGLPGGDARLLRAQMPDTGVPVLLLQMDHLFKREHLYVDARGRDQLDNTVRFASLAAAAARIARGVRGIKRPDIVHAHDWHAALTPLMMKLAGVPAKSVFTIHNLAFQGNCPLALGSWLGVPDELLAPALSDERSIEFYGTLSPMKAGIVHADRVTTVSENYAREILTPQFGHRMEGVLQACAHKLSGITNGIDDTAWNPATDPHIARHFSVADVRGKQACKRDLQQRFGLTVDPFAPLVAIGSRLTAQKLADIVAAALPMALVRHPRLQVAILGKGDAHLEQAVRALAALWPQRVGVQIGYDEATAHKLHAGADMLLHGSRFEPCGLTQMYAMRYGTVPIASRVGGLADTIVDYAPARSPKLGLPEDGATGFLFDGETPRDVASALQRALDAIMRPSSWHALQRNAMQGSFGWAQPAARYIELYAELTDARPAQRDLREALGAAAGQSVEEVAQQRRPARRAASAGAQSGAWNGTSAAAQNAHEDVARRA
ncbi:glycogen synthase GlgA [Paraburkholderia solisilvae]|uniref:Glycogen synthase n=1 Tax=Paraburkholderia solisilvae TaxID=624376 RepID=A0A6J5EXQ5_9BURK|nr:glycogen synthase GlgA [Paraburkholderia solisilvae]CAB3771379.1 Glycogen synthase [Paraburkholderia solisilvae]